ncbi:hypothetical protein A2Z22_01365 [Candidatus Woesebacteria bacterium RBG_16_34_12]|uniref:LytR/CpsA/Psr regulator C-terminal domain-containing protein n=1 Tax=Candidatus Woesebacteria bacterium RBG_16_34_12 TaxID=1802480 RepID=A0A1F7XA58_9BACT|nr:MAG: hypothetical protein A2Z22_01365 [Candidatus Woesebacteria bacterium RBG_16_34_12]
MIEDQQLKQQKEQPQSVGFPQTDSANKMGRSSRFGSSKIFSRLNKRIIFILIIVVLIAGGGLYILQEPKFDGESQESDSLYIPASPIPTQTQEENIEEKEQLNKGSVKIEVLNGTGIPKEASYLQGKLRDIGYTDIEIGNSSKQDNETTTVSFLINLDERVVEEITNQLDDIYEEVDKKTLNESDFEVTITTGLKKGQSLPTITTKPSVTPVGSTATPTSSPSATPTP